MKIEAGYSALKMAPNDGFSAPSVQPLSTKNGDWTSLIGRDIQGAGQSDHFSVGVDRGRDPRFWKNDTITDPSIPAPSDQGGDEHAEVSAVSYDNNHKPMMWAYTNAADRTVEIQDVRGSLHLELDMDAETYRYVDQGGQVKEGNLSQFESADHEFVYGSASDQPLLRMTMPDEAQGTDAMPLIQLYNPASGELLRIASSAADPLRDFSVDVRTL